MAKVYDRHDRFIGSVKDNIVYDRHRNIIGYVQNSMVLDIHYNPVSYIYNNVIYARNNMPWAYFDGKVLRDVYGNRLGHTEKNWNALLSAALLLGRGIVWYPNYYDNYNNKRYNYSHSRDDRGYSEPKFKASKNQYDVETEKDEEYEEEQNNTDNWPKPKLKDYLRLGSAIVGGTDGLANMAGRYLLSPSGLKILSKFIVK